MRTIPDYETIKSRLNQLEDEQDKFTTDGNLFEVDDFQNDSDIEAYYPDMISKENGFVSDWQVISY